MAVRGKDPNPTIALTGERTPFYPRRETAIQDAYAQIDREKLTPWAFFNAGLPLTVHDCRGRTLHYLGIEYQGSPRHVFWNGFIDPCLTDVIIEQIDRTLENCRDHPHLAAAGLDETADLLRLFVKKVYFRMAEIDQRIRGKGFPDRVQPKAVIGEIAAMHKDIDRRIEASKALLPKARRKWGALGKRFAVVGVGVLGLIGTLASIVSVGWWDWLIGHIKRAIPVFW